MTPVEIRAGASLAGVYGLRMLGLFFILPVFAVHAPKLRGGEDIALVGLALGIYGLAQGILQIPFGMASDRWGRKPVLYVGLLIFAAGSFLGIGADDIWTAIAARTLQGAGAISSVAMALAADLTREQHRTKIMAMIGSMIGLMFALSLVGAPVLYRWIGMGGLFALTGFLSLAAIWVVKTQVPDAPMRPRSAEAGPVPMRAAVLHPELLRLNAGIFILHVVLYAMFVVVPPMMVDAGLELSEHWRLYLPVVLLSFVVMIPQAGADRRGCAAGGGGGGLRRHGQGPFDPRRPDARLLYFFQCARSVATLAGVAHRPRRRPRGGDRRLQHHPDARRRAGRGIRWMGREALRRDSGLRRLRRAFGAVARGGRGNAAGAAAGQRAFECDVVTVTRGD